MPSETEPRAPEGAGVRRRALAAARTAGGKALEMPGADRVVAALERLERRRAPHLSVLMFHRIDEPERSPQLEPRLISSTPSDFERLMEFLARTRPVISLDDLIAARRSGGSLPAGAVLLTFDDATRDMATNALPTMARFDLPATIFVPTAFPESGEAFWWDRLHWALEQTPRRGEVVETPMGALDLRADADDGDARMAVRDWVWRTPHDEAIAGIGALVELLGVDEQAPGAPGDSVMSWDEMRALDGPRVAFAPHTRTHPCLDRVSVDRAIEEVRGSVRDLERELGHAPPAFAYPAGALSDELLARLPEAGIELAFTTVRGVNALDAMDSLRIARIGVGPADSPAFLGVTMMPTVAQLIARLKGR